MFTFEKTWLKFNKGEEVVSNIKVDMESRKILFSDDLIKRIYI